MRLSRVTMAGAALAAVLCVPAVAAPEPATPAASDSKENLAEAKAAAVQLAEMEERYGKLVAEFRGASPERQREIRKQAPALEAERAAAAARLASLFPRAYDENPGDAELAALLPKVLTALLQRHEFAKVIEYGRKLEADGAADGAVREALGAAYFAEHRFEDAVKAYEAARAAGGDDRQMAQRIAMARSYMPLWEAEQKIRAKEAERDDLPRVLLKTAKGDITLELFENEAPGTVGNFVSLVERGFYKGIAFHRVIPLFMAQGGDPNTLDDDPRNDGAGGPGYTIPCECYRPDRRNHFSGSLSMAHAGKDTGGSQFFITHLPTAHLNGRHTVFGRVMAGLDTARALENGDKITEATVLRKRDHEYAPPAGTRKRPH